MKKKNIYLVQAGEKTLINNNTAYFPYAVGTIAAQAWSNKTVSDTFYLKRLVFLREPPDRLADSLETPFLVGFSCYIWNTEYNKAVAQTIKERYPKCIVVFGGHHVPPDTSMLEDCDAVDVLVHGEGEEVFERLLCAYALGTPLSDIPNISFREGANILTQTPRKNMTGNDYPSPYLSGLFDDLINEQPRMHFHGTLETNRGCFNNCAFCDWGPHSATVKMFSMDRIQKDLNWLSANKVDYVWITDANFGQFDRDNQIADWIIEKKGQSGHPCSVRANYAKSNSKHVFELAKRFSESNLSKSTTISLQSLSDEALRNVGRHNMRIEHFSAIMSLYRTAGIPTYSEMILALPGETVNSFVEGIGKLLDAGQHSMIEVYDCVMLPNSVLAQKEYIQKHGISTVRLPFFQYHCEATTDDITEYADIIISTNTLSAEDWVKCKLFSIAVQSLHCMGLLRAVAVYLYNEHQVEYTAFYTHLIRWFLDNPETLGGFFFSDIRDQLYKVVSERHSPQYYDIDFGDVRWPLDEGAFLCFAKNLHRFYKEFYKFGQSFFSDVDIFEQLLIFQKNMICVPGNAVFTFSLDYDFLGYLNSNAGIDRQPLRKIKTTLTISPKPYSTPAEYAREAVWYGRRLGKTLYLNVPESICAEYSCE